jgi:hypothetical protein
MSVGRCVAAVAAAFLLAPGSALAADLAPLQGVTETLPVVVPEVSAPVSPAAPAPLVPVAVPAVAPPAIDTVPAVVRTAAPTAETAPKVQDSPQLDAAPVSRAPARAVRPQPSTERPARVAVAPKRPVKPNATVAAPTSGPRVVEETRTAAAVADAPLQLPPTPSVPLAAGISSASAGANLLAFVALLVAIFLLAVPELGARAPLAPLLRRRLHVFSLLERPG